MKETAIREARERLARAEDALAAMRATNKYSMFRRQWSYFLHAAADVYGMFHEGAKGCNTSQTWLNLKRSQRKHDELLSYVHHARDSTHHGLDQLALHAYRVEVVPGVVTRALVEWDETGDLTFHNEDVPGETIELPLTGTLSQVTDSRYGTVFAVPTQHIGQPLSEPSTFVAGPLVLAYLKEMVAEAATLPKHK
jgi:hypothetical protein